MLADMRSNGDAVSNTEDQASIGDPTSSSIDTHGDARNLSYGHHPRRAFLSLFEWADHFVVLCRINTLLKVPFVEGRMT